MSPRYMHNLKINSQFGRFSSPVISLIFASVRVNPRTTRGAHIGRSPPREYTIIPHGYLHRGKIKLGGNTAVVSAPGQV